MFVLYLREQLKILKESLLTSLDHFSKSKTRSKEF